MVHDDKNVTVLTRIADAYRKVRNFESSKETYEKVLAIEKDNQYALTGLSLLYYDFKNYRTALECWQKVLDISKDDVDIRVLTSIGNCYRKMRDFAEGLKFFEKALQKDDRNFYALFGIADCYRGMNQQFKSIEYWNKILEQCPTNKVILTRAGDAYRNAGQIDTAIQYYQRALDIEFDLYAVLGMAIIHKQQGNYTKAVDELLPLLQADPGNHRIYLELSDCYVRLGKKTEAVEVLQKFTRTGIKNFIITETLERIKNS